MNDVAAHTTLGDIRAISLHGSKVTTSQDKFLGIPPQLPEKGSRDPTPTKTALERATKTLEDYGLPLMDQHGIEVKFDDPLQATRETSSTIYKNNMLDPHTLALPSLPTKPKAIDGGSSMIGQARSMFFRVLPHCSPMSSTPTDGVCTTPAETSRNPCRLENIIPSLSRDESASFLSISTLIEECHVDRALRRKNCDCSER